MYKCNLKYCIILGALIFLLLGSINALSFEDSLDELYEVEVYDLNIDSVDEEMISGTFAVFNPTSNHFSNLYIASELYVDIPGKGTNLINKKTDSVVLPSDKTYVFSFEHDIPYSLPIGEYTLMIRLYNRTGIPLRFDWVVLNNLGNPSVNFLINDSSKSHIEKNGAKLDELSGPIYSNGEQPNLVLYIENIGDEPIEAFPEIRVYERSIFTYEGYFLSEKGESIVFDPFSEKEVRVELPFIELPDSYLAVVNFRDINDKNQISPDFEVRYVIEGVSGRIIDQFAKIGDEKLTLNYIIIGPADDSSISGATLDVSVWDKDLDKEVYSFNRALETLGKEPVNEMFSLPFKPTEQTYIVFSDLIYEDKILDATTYWYEKTSLYQDDDLAKDENPGVNLMWLVIIVLILIIIILLIISKRGFQRKTKW